LAIIDKKGAGLGSYYVRMCFRVGGFFSQNPETTFLLGPGCMHVEHHAASAPRCRGTGDQRCIEMLT